MGHRSFNSPKRRYHLFWRLAAGRLRAQFRQLLLQGLQLFRKGGEAGGVPGCEHRKLKIALNRFSAALKD